MLRRGEGARRNKILNPFGTGGTPGTPGTPPTNWSVVNATGGAVISFVGSGVEDSWPYAEWSFSGSSTTALLCRIQALTGTETYPVNGPVLFRGATKLQAGTLTNVTGMLLRSGAITGGTISTAITATSARTVYSFVQVPTSTQTVAASLQFQISVTATAALDFSLRFYLPSVT